MIIFYSYLYHTFTWMINWSPLKSPFSYRPIILIVKRALSSRALSSQKQTLKRSEFRLNFLPQRKWRRSMKHHQETPRPVRRSSGPSALSVTPSTKAPVTNKVNLISAIFILWWLLLYGTDSSFVLNSNINHPLFLICFSNPHVYFSNHHH